ncbi:MAG TPA: biotin--[acetyl-CoA-carboxylase] ligase [Thermoanaerobaculaceae bacterium]|nr:biotin--[acetyl-CoA-carboxylase] ligase [Thermoanaerobaculaceae bacterium]HRS15018.1 biotin--[acetyl-CoA-carboxylase] ligase [Thermoanaerobaculaceae bacterium]
MRRLVEPAPFANIIWLDAVDSTNDWADRIMSAVTAEDGPDLPPTVLMAGWQAAGHGSGGKSWVSPAGGLYVTWLAWLPVEALAVLPLAVGVAAATAAEALVPGLSVGLKWPNDLVVDGRKLGGMLCHARSGGDRCWVRAGLGINVACTPELAPGDPVCPTSLAEHGWGGQLGPAIWALVERFLRQLEAGLEEPGRAREQWQARLVHRLGDTMRVRIDTRIVEGRFAGLSPEGHLLLEVGGRVERVAAGELVVRLEA